MSDENISYADVMRITSSKRRMACITGADGEFWFSKLPPGNYLLRIGHRSDSQISAVHVLLTLEPHGRHSSTKDLKVEPVMSI
ncbi:MAG TPA: carboxypeptidase-like regulatory domain-containing protein [Pyrinomonadaceae bacterium]|nr:carboxypeptidase-like regulatory domain-containing protein [Pyrinomonadaceae bacterium]